MSWDSLKKAGSDHYKAGETEPIDLYKSGGTFQDFAISSIIKYAYRNRRELTNRKVSELDMKKIIHYANLLIALAPKEETVSFDIIGRKAE